MRYTQKLQMAPTSFGPIRSTRNLEFRKHPRRAGVDSSLQAPPICDGEILVLKIIWEDYVDQELGTRFVKDVGVSTSAESWQKQSERASIVAWEYHMAALEIADGRKSNAVVQR